MVIKAVANRKLSIGRRTDQDPGDVATRWMLG